MRLTTKKAFGLMEVILATSILTLVVASSTYLVQNARQLSIGSTDRNQAHSLALEGVEHVRALRDQNWANGVTTWVGNHPDDQTINDPTMIYSADANKSVVYCFQNSSKSWVKGGASDCQEPSMWMQIGVSSEDGVLAPEPPSMTGAIGSSVERIKVATATGGSQKFYRYTFIQPFNPNMHLPNFPAPPEVPVDQRPPCQATGVQCTYLNMAMENPADLKKPLDLSPTADIGNTPLALMVHVVVTWDGGRSTSKLDEAYSLITDWKPRDQL